MIGEVCQPKINLDMACLLWFTYTKEEDMITVSVKFKDWVGGFRTQEEAAELLGISRQWLNTILSGKAVGNEFIEVVNRKTGMSFEEAFTISSKEDKPNESG